MYIHAWPVKIQVYCGGYRHRTGLQQRYVGLLLKNSCLNGHRSLLEFSEKVMSTEKFWKQEIITNTPFKFVRVLQVQDRIERTCHLQFFDSSRFQRGCFYLDIIEFLNITPTKVGVCRVFPFETSFVAVFDTQHFRSPPEECQKICPPFNQHIFESRPMCDKMHDMCDMLTYVCHTCT